MVREAFLVNPPRRRNPLGYLGEGRYRRVLDTAEPARNRGKWRAPKGYAFVPGKGMVKKRVSRKRKEVKEKMARKSTKRSKAAKKAWRTRKATTAPRRRRRRSVQVKVKLGSHARGHVRSIKINRPRRNPGKLFLVGNRPRRRHRRNPALKVGEFDFVKNLPLIAAGGISAISLVAIPKWLKLETSSKLIQYGAKVGVVAGGGFLLGKTLGTNYAYSWMLAGSAVVLANFLEEYVFPSVLPGIVGLRGIGAFPAIPAISAYPGESYQLEGSGIGNYEVEETNPYN